MLQRIAMGLAVSAMAAVGASQAAAATTTTTTTPTTTTTTPAPLPAPAPAPAPAAHLSLSIRHGLSLKRHIVTVPGRSVTIRGVVRPYVPGQVVELKAYLHHKVIKSATLRIVPAHGAGAFVATISTRRPGTVIVTVDHHATQTLGPFFKARVYRVLDDQVGFGATGPFVQLIQQRLAALHFYIPQTGRYDSGTGLAVDAYHRLLHRGTSQTLDHATLTWLLNGWGKFKLRFPRHGRHAEGNLSVQLLALANGSHVYRIYPISSGKPSTPTVLGDFHVYQKTPGYLPDGMYFSSFFTGGYAIHGFDPAPDYPASHGCMRVPIDDAISIYAWLRLGNWVDVYY